MKLLRKLVKRTLPPKIIEMLRRGYYSYLRFQQNLYRHKMLFLFSMPHFLFRKYQYPKHLSIFLTSRCNFHCFICDRDENKAEDLMFENIYKLENAIRYARTINLTSVGEALLYPKIEEVLKYVYSLNTRRNLIGLATNGSLLSEQFAHLLNGHLNNLRISLNAASEKTYERDMRGGKFARTLLSIRAFLNALNPRERCKVSLHLVAHKDNFREIPDFVLLASSLGILHVTIGQYIISDETRIPYSLLHVKEEYNAVIAKARAIGDRLGITVAAKSFFEGRHFALRCMALFDECCIRENGDVAVCCVTSGDDRHSVGNAYRDRFEDIWLGRTYRELRKAGSFSACLKCRRLLPFDDYYTHCEISLTR